MEINVRFSDATISSDRPVCGTLIFGVAKDAAEAMRWYRKAADAGDAPGMNNLGAMYENGTGVAKDLPEAIRWYRKAADAGFEGGIRNLRRMKLQ